MSSLVERLRAFFNPNGGQKETHALMTEAANEIERLREALIYAAETTSDEHTSRKLWEALSLHKGGRDGD